MAWPVFPVCFFGGGFIGGNQSANTIQELAQSMLLGGETTSPTAGGTLTINGVGLGSYDYLIKKSSQTISSFTASDWFTSTEDTRSAWIVVDGGLTINSGQTVIPSVRKLFTVLYVRGNLTVNGSISMTARGANHSGTGNSGGATTAQAIRIINGTYSGVTNPQIPASGGTAGTGATNQTGSAGSAGSAGGTGGGGGGGSANDGAGSSGAAGTSFSAGGGGGARNGASGTAPTNAVANGGRGGDGGGNNSNACGGAGNPGGSSLTTIYGGTGTAIPGNGTGGVLIVFCTGAISGSGSLVANGSAGGGGGNTACGGGSGGGSITLLYGSGTPTTLTANGGAGNNGTAGNQSGGAGGAGTARALVLV